MLRESWLLRTKNSRGSLKTSSCVIVQATQAMGIASKTSQATCNPRCSQVGGRMDATYPAGGAGGTAILRRPAAGLQFAAMAEQKSWQARISEATDKLAQSFVESISYDRRMYKQDIAGSIAHATMLAKVGLINDSERDKIIEGLKSIEKDIEAGKFQFDESLEDIHMVVEDALIKRIGEPGKKLHTGRSRNDQV